MRFLLLPVLVLMILVSLAAGVALVIGQRLPMTERLAVMHLTDCQLPCWIGIVPGKTSMDEARQRIRDEFGDKQGISLDESQTYCCIVVTFESNSGPESHLYIRLNKETAAGSDAALVGDLELWIDHQLPVEIYGLLGPPTRYEYAFGMDALSGAPTGGPGLVPQLVFDTCRCELFLGTTPFTFRGVVTLTTPIAYLAVEDTSAQQSPLAQLKPQRWQGFGSFYGSIQGRR